MKKIILIILFLSLISCNKYIVQNIYEKTYNNADVAIVDVYTNLHYYNVDSISLDDWITNDMSTDTISITQKTILKPISKNSVYSFVFSKYVYPSSLYYHFLIRFTGVKKDLQKQ